MKNERDYFEDYNDGEVLEYFKQYNGNIVEFHYIPAYYLDSRPYKILIRNENGGLIDVKLPIEEKYCITTYFHFHLTKYEWLRIAKLILPKIDFVKLCKRNSINYKSFFDKKEPKELL